MLGPRLRKRKAGGWGGWEIQLFPQGGVGGQHEAREVEALGKDPLGGGCKPHPPQSQAGNPAAHLTQGRGWEPAFEPYGPDSLGTSRDGPPARMTGRTHFGGAPSPSPRRSAEPVSLGWTPRSQLGSWGGRGHGWGPRVPLPQQSLPSHCLPSSPPNGPRGLTRAGCHQAHHRGSG